MTEICLERDTANDESAVLVGILVKSGDEVANDELLFEIENSKATQELRAPHAGILSHQLVVGQTVEFGVPIAHVHDGSVVETPPAAAPPLPIATPVAPTVTDPLPAPRFSQAAATLIAKLGVSTDGFTSGFVTSEQVRARHAPPSRQEAPAQTLPLQKPLQAGPAFVGGAPMPGRKRAEIEALSSGAGNTMLSVLGVTLGSVAARRVSGGPSAAPGFLDGRITDLVIYEASRLMRKFPRLNAFFADGQVVEHQAVHAGLAIDSGGRLMVYGIEHADRLALPALTDMMEDAVERYVNGTLTAAELSRATFTVTDLSAYALDFVLPLLPRGQSCIIGITQQATTGFRIFAGFDHRVTEGREVAIFLNELRDRVLSFALPHTLPGTPADAPAECGYCGRSAAEAAGKAGDKGLLKTVDGHGRDVLCCGSCWHGW